MLPGPSDGSALYPPSPEDSSSDSFSDPSEDSSVKADASDADPSPASEDEPEAPIADCRAARRAAIRAIHA